MTRRCIKYTLSSTYNEKTYAEIFPCYRWLFVKGNIIIGEWEIFGAEVFLHHSQFFIKGNFVIDGVECTVQNRWNQMDALAEQPVYMRLGFLQESRGIQIMYHQRQIYTNVYPYSTRNNYSEWPLNAVMVVVS